MRGDDLRRNSRIGTRWVRHFYYAYLRYPFLRRCDSECFAVDFENTEGALLGKANGKELAVEGNLEIANIKSLIVLASLSIDNGVGFFQLLVKQEQLAILQSDQKCRLFVNERKLFDRSHLLALTPNAHGVANNFLLRDRVLKHLSVGRPDQDEPRCVELGGDDLRGEFLSGQQVKLFPVEVEGTLVGKHHVMLTLVVGVLANMEREDLFDVKGGLK